MLDNKPTEVDAMLKTAKPEIAADVRLRSADTTEADNELAQLAKALGHPLRIQIVRLLAKRTTCVCGELVGELPVAQSTVSQHLKILKEAGLIQGTIDRPRVCYCLAPGALQRLKALVNSLPETCEGEGADLTTRRTCR
jgi:ArsR family transcriptional regulator